MQIGVIGLGRMGGNISRRLIQNGHEVVVYDHDPKAIAPITKDGAKGADDLKKLVAQLRPPRPVWVMLPAGKITEDTILQLGKLLDAGDIVLDGGNTFWKDDIRRAKMLKERNIHHVDVGTSGGVWGLERGYCMMIGGDKPIVDRLDPIFKALAPGLGNAPRTPGRNGRDPRAEQGYIHAGPNGAGHFVKMIHNGIEYGLMQAFAEGFDILKNASSDALPQDHRFNLDLTDIAEVWRRGSVISSWLLDLTASALTKDPEARRLRRHRRGFRRRSLDDHGGDRRGGARGCSVRRALHPLPLAPRPHLRREDPLGDAQRLRRSCRAETGAQGQIVMNSRTATTSARQADPCSFVIFGASGDLTHRLLVPALYNLAASGLLPEDFALIGVARSSSTSEAFRDDLVKSLPKFATRDIDERIVKKLLGCVAYVEGEPNDETTYKKIGAELSRIERKHATKGNRLFYLATPPAAFMPIGCGLGQSGLAREENGGAWRRVVIEKPFGTDLASARKLNEGLLRVLKEDQIYRIDHYLGKETVQNIMVLRFANGLFEPIWNRHHIEHVQITVAESLDRRTPRQLLRRDRRFARHGAESPDPAVVAHRHGAAITLCRQLRAQREGASARCRAISERRRAAQFGARAIWRWLCRQPPGRGLSQDQGRQA